MSDREPVIEPLTAREQEIVTLIGRGLTDKQICAELYIMRQTVRTHISKIMLKRHLSNRVKIALYAHGITIEEAHQ